MPPIPDASEIRPRPAVKSNQPAVVQPGAAAAAVSKPQGPDTASSAAEVNSAALPTLPELPEPPPAASESIVTPAMGTRLFPRRPSPAAVAPAGNAPSPSTGRPAGEAPALRVAHRRAVHRRPRRFQSSSSRRRHRLRPPGLERPWSGIQGTW